MTRPTDDKFMATPDPTYNPDLPADEALASAAELRGQFQGLQVLIDEAKEHTHEAIAGISPLDLEISDPPTQDEVTQVKDRLNELIAALKT